MTVRKILAYLESIRNQNADDRTAIAGSTQTGIACVICVPIPTVCRNLRKMTSQGLTEKLLRRIPGFRRRQWTYRLTPSGLACARCRMRQVVRRCP